MTAGQGSLNSPPPMLRLERLTFAYPNHPPLFVDYDWRVEAGEAWAVIGPSGSGKSTLLYLLAGLRQPTGGEILVSGERLVRPRPRTGLILQDYGLLPWATVAQNAALGLRVRRFYGPDGRHAPEGERLPRAEVDRRVDFWLRRLGIDALGAKYPAQISGGQRQRTAIARTLAMNPDLLLMDEPFSSLDALTREDLERLTLELQLETGLATVIVTHNIEEAVYLGSRLLVLRHPPHEAPLVIDNPAAGSPDYRHDPGFQARCNEVRDLLGGDDARA